MFRRLILSLAVAAASGVSSFVGSPKNLITDYSSVYGSYSFVMSQSNNDWSAETPFGNFDGSPTYDSVNQEMRFDFENDQNADIRIWGGWTSQYGSFSVEWFFSNYEMASDFNTQWLLPIANGQATFDTNVAYNDDSLSEPESTQEGYKVYLSFTWDEWPEEKEDGFPPVYVSFRLGNPTYNLQKNFVNCEFAASPVLPNTYTGDGQLTYRCTFVSRAGGYGFTSSSISQTGGITIRSVDLFDEYGTSGYYASLTFLVDLPLSDCSLTVEAFLPTFSFSSQLSNCTVSPSFPSSVSGNFIETYTFTAADGYGFHEDDISWDITNMFIDSVSFSSLLSGNGESGYFYSKVILKLRFNNGGNVLVKVTASPFDVNSYNRGYSDGEKDGYRDGYAVGHRDGEIAGDSYGVWNWLKQAALTTGEFLNIPLLPGFSIGALLTALAGLMIIWLFIKGFLFKS